MHSIKCPLCKTETTYDPTSPWRPFCSLSCRQQDLAAWASERYTVPDTSPHDISPELNEPETNQ